jgi:hypothetical protein
MPLVCFQPVILQFSDWQRLYLLSNPFNPPLEGLFKLKEHLLKRLSPDVTIARLFLESSDLEEGALNEPSLLLDDFDAPCDLVLLVDSHTDLSVQF